MKQNDYFELELPQHYRAVKTVDASSKKLTIWLNVVALGLMLLVLLIGFLILKPDLDSITAIRKASTGMAILRLILFSVGIFAYIVLHELVHGAAYKLLTGRKLKFGFTATVAFCGVPDIYVYRKTALISLLAPFVVFNVVFVTAILISGDILGKTLSTVMLGIHISGCTGDLYDTLLYLFRFRDSRTLMRDTGPAQTFYLP